MSQSLNPRSAADLQKLNSLADERQTALDRREKEILIRESKQKEDFKFSEARLIHVTAQITKAEAKLGDTEKLISADLIDLKQQRKDLTKKLDEKKSEVAPVERMITSRKHDLVEIERQIKERKGYRETQEVQIEVVITDLNDQLKSIAAEIGRLTMEKEDLLRQNYHSEQDHEERQKALELLIEEISAKSDKLDDLTKLYEETAAKYKADLQKLKQTRVLYTEANEKLSHELDEREHKVGLREKELEVQSDILKKADEGIMARRRKLESDLSLL